MGSFAMAMRMLGWDMSWYAFFIGVDRGIRFAVALAIVGLTSLGLPECLRFIREKAFGLLPLPRRHYWFYTASAGLAFVAYWVLTGVIFKNTPTDFGFDLVLWISGIGCIFALLFQCTSLLFDRRVSAVTFAVSLCGAFLFASFIIWSVYAGFSMVTIGSPMD